MRQVGIPSSGRLGAALLGGVTGAVVMAALLFFAAPQLVGGRIVRAAIMADPQILVDAGQVLRDKQYEPVLAEHRAEIETPFATSWKGASKPDVTLVEFFDYACPYCKASNPSVERLLGEDKGLRVVYRELPILGPESVTAARLSLAASKAGRFGRFHDALWDAGRPSPQTLAAASQAAAIPAQPGDSAEIDAELKKNFALAGELGATGTPLFVVGNRVINNAASYEELKQAIADARSNG